MTYTYTRYMRDGTTKKLTGSRTDKQVRTGKTKRDRAKNKSN